MTLDADGKEIPDGATPAVDEAAAAEAVRLADVEARARLMGWKDKSEFDRPPERWVDAETFVARGENILPVLKENLHRVEAALSDANRKIADMQADSAANAKAVEHIREMGVTAEVRAFERAKREIERERRETQKRLDEAAATADVAGVRTASAELAALKDPEPPKPAPEAPRREAPAPAPVVADVSEAAAVAKFAADNASWFKPNSEAGDYASARYGSLLKERPGLSHTERLDEVRKAVVRRFPEVFENPAAREAPRVAAPSGTGPTGGGRKRGWTFDDLPPDVKAVADKTIADLAKGYKGPKDKAYGRQDYVNTYFAGQEPPR